MKQISAGKGKVHFKEWFSRVERGKVVVSLFQCELQATGSMSDDHKPISVITLTA